ncbi:DUF2975 domain-containing protein [Glycomyces sp. NRRL B-16210]|uniref:DUF2975 domain-containing protein n=1 Tax=Glycomyces sp. NRRL B-16210 TaxID=1463821 RepID=UPI0004C2267D|nr:DUF2975 domain-containing protein [Glycomyces sp. NRRL B-16210]
MHSFFIAALRAVLAVTFLAGLFGQIVVVPVTAADEVDLNPAYAPYQVPYTIAGIVGIACIQVVLVAAWVLLGMIERDAIFSARAFRWVDVIIGATVAASLTAASVTVHLLFSDIPAPEMELIGAVGATGLCAAAGATFAMLLFIMRGLLRKATELQAEMAEVV